LEILDRHSWPGNVRELENLVERTVVFSRDKVITRDCLPDLFRTPREAAAAPAAEGDGLDLKEQTLAFQRRLIETALAGGNLFSEEEKDSLGRRLKRLTARIQS